MVQTTTNIRLYTYETSAQFAAASGFLPEDVGRVIAYVQETDAYHALKTYAPTWTALGANVPAGSIDTDELAAGALAATATGRAIIEAGFFNEATVDAKFAAGAIDDDRLKAIGATRAIGGRNEGQPGVGYFYLTGAVSDTELVTLNGRTYEFDTDATSTGDVAVDVSGDQTADAAITALVAAINGDSSREFDAVAMAGNADTSAGCLLVATAADATNRTIATDAANGVVSAAAVTGEAAAANTSLWAYEYTVTSADVTELARTGGNSVAVMAVNSTTQPKLVGLTVRTSAGAMVVPVATLVWTWAQANSNFWVLAVDDGAASLTAGDIIGVAAVV